MYGRLHRMIGVTSVLLLLGAGGIALTPRDAEAAPSDQYGCPGGPCLAAAGPWAGPPPGLWAGPPDPSAYADAVNFTDYVNLTNAIGHQNVVNAVTYQNLANAAAYRNTLRVATYQAAVTGR